MGGRIPSEAERMSKVRASVEIYKSFFIAGIISVLTAGCGLGALALFGIAQRGTYLSSAWTPYVLAHANSQLYGWVGFFIMGFALQHHPPSRLRQGLFHQLAFLSLILMGVGIAVRFVAEPMVSAGNQAWLGVGVASAWAQFAAVLLFFVNTSVTRFRTGERMTWPTAFVFASLGWLAIVSFWEPFAFAGSHGPAAIPYIAEWFPPLRDAQFLGFVANMIFGVAFVKMSECFGAKAPNRIAGVISLLLWNVGLTLRVFGWTGYFESSFTSSGMLRTGTTLLAAGGLLAIANLRLFEGIERQTRSHKFLRAAMVWLWVGLCLLAFEPVYLSRLGSPFSHAYTGAIRHAVTVGFISMMIIGVSTHMMARMRDLDPYKMNPLWATFWLLNVGNCARVALEIATDWTPAAFSYMGYTGFVELLGLAFWAANSLSILTRRPPTVNAEASHV